MMPTESLMEKYRTMFLAARKGRVQMIADGGELHDYSLVVLRIQRAIQEGKAKEKDIDELDRIRELFRKK